MGMAAMLVMWPNSFVYFFIPILLQAFIWTLVPNRPTVFEKNKFFDQGQRMTLTFDTHSTSLTHLAKCFKQIWNLRLQ